MPSEGLELWADALRQLGDLLVAQVVGTHCDDPIVAREPGTALRSRRAAEGDGRRAELRGRPLPSEHFKRQCLISAEPNESIAAQIIAHLAAEYVVWALDYPRLDASFNVVGQLRERIAGLPDEWQRKVLGENALRFYGLAGRAA